MNISIKKHILGTDEKDTIPCSKGCACDKANNKTFSNVALAFSVHISPLTTLNPTAEVVIEIKV